MFVSTSPSKFNIASMETQTEMHRMGLNPFLTFYIDAMLNVDASANANVKCEHTLKRQQQRQTVNWIPYEPNGSDVAFAFAPISLLILKGAFILEQKQK